MSADRVTESFNTSINAAGNGVQDFLKQYQQWVSSYQGIGKGFMGPTNIADVGFKQWQRHLEFMRAVTEASIKMATATRQYMEASISEASTGWQQVAQVTTDEVMQQQDRIRQKVRSAT